MPEDTALALAWDAEQRLRCPGCGAWLDHTTRPEAEDAYEVEGHRCHRCAAIAHASQALVKGRGDPAGMHWIVHDPEPPEEVTGIDD